MCMALVLSGDIRCQALLLTGCLAAVKPCGRVALRYKYITHILGAATTVAEEFSVPARPRPITQG